MCDPSILQTQKFDELLKSLARRLRLESLAFLNAWYDSKEGANLEELDVNLPRKNGRIWTSTGILGNYQDLQLTYLVPKCTKRTAIATRWRVCYVKGEFTNVPIQDSSTCARPKKWFLGPLYAYQLFDAGFAKYLSVVDAMLFSMTTKKNNDLIHLYHKDYVNVKRLFIIKIKFLYYFFLEIWHVSLFLVFNLLTFKNEEAYSIFSVLFCKS